MKKNSHSADLFGANLLEKNSKNLDYSLWGKQCIVLPKWTLFHVLAHCVSFNSQNVLHFYDIHFFYFLKSALVTTISQRKMMSVFEIRDTVRMVSVFPCSTGQIITNWMLSWPFPIWREILKKNTFWVQEEILEFPELLFIDKEARLVLWSAQEIKPGS